LLFGVKLRNKSAKWEIAEKTKKKSRQAQTFSSSLFTQSFPSTGPVQAIEVAQIFRRGACQLSLHSIDAFGATLHFGFASALTGSSTAGAFR
jgi:hypothetical protein